ncbi:unnamed protein product, partial [Rotaria sordida]
SIGNLGQCLEEHLTTEGWV